MFYPFSIGSLSPHPIVPPAWSLATEFHFYLLLPLIFTLKRRNYLILVLITLGIQFSSFFCTYSYFNSNNFGYRYIFGVLTVFLFGYAFAEQKDVFFKRVTIGIWLTFSLFLFVITPAFGAWKNPNVQEVLFGGFVALPLGYVFTSEKNFYQSMLFKRVDHLFGNLAYPIFISHFLSFYLIEKLFGISIANRPLFYMLSIILCLSLSFLLYLFQKRVEIYRIERRGFSSLKSSSNSGVLV